MAELIYPDAANWINSYEAGQKAGMTDRKDQAMTRAGGLMSSGDYAGAAKALYGVGDIQNGAVLQKAGQDQTQQAEKLTRHKTVQDKLAQGDFAGAYAAAGTDSDLLEGLDKVAAHAKETTTTMAGALQALKGPDGQWLPADQAAAKYEAMKPTLLARGLDPRQVNSYVPTPENNAAIEGQVLGLAEQLKLRTPNWHEVKRADGSTEFVDLNPYNTQGSQGSQPSGATPPAEAPQPTGAVPRGLRNNNPLNVSSLPEGHTWDGQTGTDGRYPTFATPEQGWTAADKNLQAYATHHGISTVAGIIGRWAPHGENDTAAYTSTVAKALGVDPNAQLNLSDPATRQKVLTAMAGVENGQPVQFGQGAPPHSAPATVTPQSMSAGIRPTVAGSAAQAPEWQSDGHGNLVNRRTGDRKTDPTASGSTAADPNIVKGLIEGRITPPTQKAATSDYWQAQLQAAAQQDPTFDMVNFQARAKARADFTSGKSAQNITALNTVIGHLDHLDRTIDDLGNTGPGGALNFGPLNSLNNSAARMIAGSSGTDARFKNFETAKTAVANELTRVFRGTGGAEADIQGWMKQLDGAGSPEALHKVVQSMAELINSRVEALGEQYHQGMGTTADPITLLTPDKQKSFARLMGGSREAPTPQRAAPAGVIRYDAQGNRIP